jgi:hypothetical protein
VINVRGKAKKNVGRASVKVKLHAVNVMVSVRLTAQTVMEMEMKSV